MLSGGAISSYSQSINEADQFSYSNYLNLKHGNVSEFESAPQNKKEQTKVNADNFWVTKSDNDALIYNKASEKWFVVNSYNGDYYEVFELEKWNFSNNNFMGYNKLDDTYMFSDDSNYYYLNSDNGNVTQRGNAGMNRQITNRVKKDFGIVDSKNYLEYYNNNHYVNEIKFDTDVFASPAQESIKFTKAINSNIIETKVDKGYMQADRYSYYYYDWKSNSIVQVGDEEKLLGYYSLNNGSKIELTSKYIYDGINWIDYNSIYNSDYSINNKNAVYDANNELQMVSYDKNTYKLIFKDTGLNYNDVSFIQQTENGNFWIEENNGDLYYYDFNTNTLNYTKTMSGEAILADEHYFVYEDNNGNLRTKADGVSFSNYNNEGFYQGNKLYVDDNDFKIKLNSSNIKSVELNNKYLSSKFNNYWEIDFSEFENESNENIKITYDDGSVVSMNVAIYEDYMPALKVNDEQMGNKKVDRYVYDDNDFGLIDGYYSEGEKILNFNDQWLIDSIKIDNKQIYKENWRNYEYNPENQKKSNIELTDKFGQTWTYELYNKFSPQKYWYQTKEGINNANKAEKMGYTDNDIASLNAQQSEHYSAILNNTFDLNDVTAWSDSDLYDETMEEALLEANGGHRIPDNYMYADDQLEGGMPYREWYENYTVDYLNEKYNLDLKYGDIDMIFTNNDVNKNKEKLNIYNQSFILKASAQGMESGRVVGETTDGSNSGWTNEWVDLGDFYTYSDGAGTAYRDDYLELAFSDWWTNLDEKEQRNMTFHEAKPTLENLISSSLDDYIKSDDYVSFVDGSQDFSMIDITKDDFTVDFYNQTLNNESPSGWDLSVPISGTTKLKDLDNYSIAITAKEGQSVLTGSGIINDIESFSTMEKVEPVRKGIVFLWIVLGVIGLGAIALIIYVFISRHKQKKLLAPKIGKESTKEKG